MCDIIRFIIAALCTLLGMISLISGVFGVFRFKNTLSRLQSAAVIDTTGIMFMLLGLMFATAETITNAKMLITIILLWLTSPVSSHLICRMEVAINDEPEKDITITDKDAVNRERTGK